jgi:hypothetical protein
MQFLIQSYAFDKEFHTFLQGLVITAVRSVDQQQLQPVVAAVAPAAVAPAAVAPAAAASAVGATTAALDDTSDLPWQQLTHVNVATVTGDIGMIGNSSSHHNDHGDVETSSDTAATATAVTTAGNKRKVLSPDASSNVSEVRETHTLCNASIHNCQHL